uniref:BACK domain-containing protein n=1 Tax=Cuerna arida TaxID=1464854 RepID=A0A1B6FZA1_9HEMI
MLQSDTKQFLSSNDFKFLDRRIVEFILRQEHLEIDEIDLWWALLSWAKHNHEDTSGTTTVRKTLGNMLTYIRFLAMSLKEFAEEVVKTSILTDYEIIHVFVALATGKPHGLKYLSESGKRCPQTFVLEFNGYLPVTTSSSSFSHTITVKNRRLKLKSGNMMLAISFSVKLQQNQTNILTFGPFSNCSSFTADVILEANESYNLVFTSHSGQSMQLVNSEPQYSCNYCTVSVNSSCIRNLTFVVL